MSLRRTLLLLAIIPVALVTRRLGLFSYSVNPDRLPRRAFTHLRVDFLQCPDCGKDGRLVINGQQMAQIITHGRAVRMLNDWAHCFSGVQYAQLYRQVATATWLKDFEPMPPLPCGDQSTFAQVHTCVRSAYEARVLQWAPDEAAFH